ncbi:putative cystathionine gamma-synthase [Rosellinia necatrix]|uniref:Putative cystathionine gamma-synthase n=1 Tax=Rosellinia necatrix TaxID=77044 RepID=A0A1W2TNW5_ROSNE|nr:putative cystathionine gamma-synthase [Rosellinia necatrix]
MRPTSPHALALGISQPPNENHAVSVSLPTWHSIVSWSRREPWVVSQMQGGYPRLFINSIIQELSSRVLERLQPPDAEMGCMIMASMPAALRLTKSLEAKKADGFVSPCIHFGVPPTAAVDAQDKENSRWAAFHVVLYSSKLTPEAMSFWRETGDGISSRHAEYALRWFPVLESQCADISFCTKPTMGPNEARVEDLSPPLPPAATTAAQIAAMKSLLATSAASDDPGQASICPQDIFLYPKGLSGIYAVARSLVPDAQPAQKSQAVIYGQVFFRWPYAETVKCVERSGWDNVIIYGHGTEADLDDLEGRLRSGERIQVLFCELPSNPQLASPDLHRIRRLADAYGFIVACDETLGTFVNVDILPYVDIAMTSLTKIFSGASDVMGGSVIVNRQSRFYQHVHSRLSATWEDILFPGDIGVLASNCRDFAERVRYCSRSASTIATLVSKHPAVARVYYPTLVPSRPLYERYRRRDAGYGYVLSIIFHDPCSAVAFYDTLDVCKGTSIGANFTLAVPYAQLAHFRELDLAAANGIPRHIVRISVGIDDTQKLADRVERALMAAATIGRSALGPVS